MTAILFALTVLALVVYGLERNHRRPRLGSRLAGSTNTEDRDLARVVADLHAATAHSTADRPAVPRRQPVPVRSIRPARSA